jgi:hypothetical protein
VPAADVGGDGLDVVGAPPGTVVGGAVVVGAVVGAVAGVPRTRPSSVVIASGACASGARGATPMLRAA